MLRLATTAQKDTGSEIQKLKWEILRKQHDHDKNAWTIWD
jgi:hypothetical protein